MPELAFVMSAGQNWFFHDLVATVRDELALQGIPSFVSTEGFPAPRDDRVYVLVPPHEFVALEGEGALPEEALLARTIGLCAEQPGTVHFDANVALTRRLGAVFDINRRSVELLRAAGVPARPFQVGWARRWDHFAPEAEREIDVLFLGCSSLRRSRLLAGMARQLARWNCHLQLSDNSRPNPGDSETFRAEGKWELLTRAKVLLNLHQGDEPYFEWMRALDAVHAGAVLVSEHSSGVRPLVPGRHLLLARPASLGHVVDELLREPDRLRDVRTEAHAFVSATLPMAPSVAALVGAATELLRHDVAGVAAPPRRPSRALRRPRPRTPAPLTPEGADARAMRRALKEMRLDMLDLRRQFTRLEGAVRDGAPPPRVVLDHASPGWRARRNARVTVITPVYNHADDVVEALDSLRDGSFDDLEAVVVDDGSSDGSARVVRRWSERHGHFPLLLARHPVNRGLGAARNTALDLARGEYTLALDADNTVYPRCVRALVVALDAEPGAAFAYPILEAFGQTDAYVAGAGDYLLSKLAWEPWRLREGNLVDAFALVRAAVLRSLGGYATDRRLHGWEDYDLWCRMAEHGHRGRLVPQMLGRYRASPSSMLSLTNISGTDAMAALIERSPTLMAGLIPPV